MRLFELIGLGILKFIDWFWEDKEGEQQTQEIMDKILNDART